MLVLDILIEWVASPSQSDPDWRENVVLDWDGFVGAG